MFREDHFLSTPRWLPIYVHIYIYIWAQRRAGGCEADSAEATAADDLTRTRDRRPSRAQVLLCDLQAEEQRFELCAKALSTVAVRTKALES